ncbi:polysaccharide biosynthesis protein [Haloimpatiens sp. FM7315]|uniref:polysaccharide biosynthesis protein n=1 Tax=Haloimpatiens sp. FM7315 TaxID=3298609 RepID=UPI00370BBDEB
MNNDKKFILYDIILIIASLYLALLLRLDFKISPEYMKFFWYSIIPVTLMIILFNSIFKLYNKVWKYASIEELLSIVYSISISNVVFILYSYFITYKIFENNYYRFPFTVHIIFWLLSVVSLGGIRFVYRIIGTEKLKDCVNADRKKVLIIGAGDAGVLLLKEVKKHKEFNFDVVGFIDDDSSKKGKVINGVQVLGDRKDIIKASIDYEVDEIIMAIPSAEIDTKKDIISVCKETKCKLKTIPGIYEIIDGKVNISKIRDVDIEDLLGREPVKLDSKDIDKYIKDKIVLVTGGGGSIGSELCRQITKFKPKKLLILDIYENNAYDIQRELVDTHPELDLEVLIASIRDEKRIREIFSKYRPNVVFHAAAHKHVPLMEENPKEAIKNNVVGTYNVVKICSEYGVNKFVQISTDKAVNPTNIMGATKRFCEMMIQAFDKISATEYVAVRFGNVLGSNGSVIPLFKKQIARGGPVTVTHPEINRFFMTIPEAAQLVIQAGGMANGGEIFVLDMGKPVKMVDLAKDLIALSGLELDRDIKIEYTGLRPGEKLYEELLMDEVALTSTKHQKIFVEKPMAEELKFIEKSVEEFREVSKVETDNEEVFKLMEEKVPTYKRKKN